MHQFKTPVGRRWASTIYLFALLIPTGVASEGVAVEAVPEAARSRIDETSTGVAQPTRRPLRLLVDEYRHPPRPETFSQGFSLERDEQSLTYHYDTEATARVNGLFFLSQLIADDYQMTGSRDPIDGNLGDRADAFMIICPGKDGPHPLTEEDANHLESFVADGGILILMYNSVANPAKDGFDYEGMNRIAQKFGVEILQTTTRSILIPIKRDNPAFFGARNIIYGNGCTFATRPQPDTEHTTLLESSNPDVPGAVAVRARYRKGTVLLIGDAGVVGNAHMVRTDVGHTDAVKQLFHCLLPEGPLAGYGWGPGLKMKVTLDHELAITGAPHGMRLLDLPLDPATKSLLTGVRDIDLQSAPDAVKNMTAEEAAKALPVRRYALARANWRVETELEFGESDGRASAATWRGPSGAAITARITPRGEVIDASADSDELTEWRWALTNAILLSPLDPVAQVGDGWKAPVNAAVPNTQLRPAPMLREVQADFRMVGRQEFRGRDCFIVTRRIIIPLDDLRPQEIVNREYADYFDEQKVRLRHAGHAEETTAWIDAVTRLPVRTEMQTSTTYWWTDRNEEDRYVSDHDHRVLETSYQVRRVTIVGRLLSADFEVVQEEVDRAEVRGSVER